MQEKPYKLPAKPPLYKTAQGLVSFAQKAVGLPYVISTYGKVLTPAMFDAVYRAHPESVRWHGAYLAGHRQSIIGKRTFDCIGLIKGYLWSDNAGVIRYGAGGVPDINQDDMFANALLKGKIGTLPEKPGLLVWKRGHIGIYEGAGYVIEAKDTPSGVIRSPLAQGGWSHWLACPYLIYKEETKVKPGTYQVTLENDSYLNLRTGPGMHFPVQTRLSRGSVVTVAEITGSWGRVIAPALGFVSFYNNGKSTLTRIGDVPADDRERQIAALEARLALVESERAHLQNTLLTLALQENGVREEDMHAVRERIETLRAQKA